MATRKVVVLVLVAVLSVALVLPVYAGPRGKSQCATSTSAAQPTPAERVGNETANAVADVLTGESSQAQTQQSTGNTPPGLAKKGKTPPGWEKGKKTGWNKEEGQPAKHKNSPIDSFIKGLFGQK